MDMDFTAVARAALEESPDFWEYPSHTLTLELCRSFARLEKRSINQALRACAATLAANTSDDRLRKLLIGMSNNRFPEGDIAVLRNANKRFINQMVKAMQLVEEEKCRLHQLHPEGEDYRAAVAALAEERRKMKQGLAA